MKFFVLTLILTQLLAAQNLVRNGLTQTRPRNAINNQITEPAILTANRFRFYSPNAQEALLKYQFTVELVKNSQPTESEFKTGIEKQITFLFGAFSHQFRQAVPKADQNFQILKVYRVNATTWRADYLYNGYILITNGPVKYSFYLPLNPYQTWKKSIVQGAANPYPCTDSHYAFEKYFWYFFNPKAYGCTLVENQDYAQVQGQVQIIGNTKATYPEYERLFVNGELDFHILFGMDNSTLDWNPQSSKDLSAQSYRQLKQALTQWGYTSKVWTSSEINSFFGNLGFYGQKPFVEELTKQTPKGIIKYRIFFGASTVYEGTAFQKFLAYSLKNSSIMLYAGHSGLGEYLNLDLMQNNVQLKMTADQNRYQIYFFNSCSSYPYYNSQYFSLKQTAQDPKGTKNLDIITNGLSTYFSAIAPSSFALMQAVEYYGTQNRKLNYQEIISTANSDNLIGINGDEDNN